MALNISIHARLEITNRYASLCSLTSTCCQLLAMLKGVVDKTNPILREKKCYMDDNFSILLKKKVKILQVIITYVIKIT